MSIEPAGKPDSGRHRVGSVVALVASAGGIVIVQDQAIAAYFGMPWAAMRRGKIDKILPLDAIAPELVRLMAVEDPHERAE